MRRYELTDAQWQSIEDLFPKNQSCSGRPWNDHRTVLNGMFWVLCSGAPWRDLPERYGAWQTAYHRFRRYREEGFFQRLLERLHLRLNEQGQIDLELWAIDSTSVRGQKSAAGGGPKKGARQIRQSPQIMALDAAAVAGAPRFTG